MRMKEKECMLHDDVGAEISLKLNRDFIFPWKSCASTNRNLYNTRQVMMCESVGLLLLFIALKIPILCLECSQRDK
jgi:hypothetical protein